MRRTFAVRALTLFAASPPPRAPSNPGRLQYDHAYHAGNYADVVKHAVLVRLLGHMHKKTSPMTYVETHAGRGVYPLDAREARTLAEHDGGVARLAGASPTPEAEVGCDNDGAALADAVAGTLLDLMQRLSKEAGDGEGTSPVYPGSPVVAASLLRDHDSLLLCEKEAGPCDRLREAFAGDSRATLLHENGYAALKKYENLQSNRRGLVFIDPPYQLGSDTEQIARLVRFLRRHWRSARVAIWHPVSRGGTENAERLYDQVARACDGADLLATELYDADTDRVGAGMLLVQPPYGIDDELRALLPELGRRLGEVGSARVRVERR